MKNEEQELISQAEELIEQSNLVKAKSLLLKILKDINPNSINAMNDLSVIFILEENYTLAVQYLTKVLSIDSTNELALSNSAYLSEKLKELTNTQKPHVSCDNRVSIIIPVFNKIELTLNCLRSLNGINSSIQFEVIIVDNASLDQTKDEVERIKSTLNYDINYKRNENNLGFAKANNIGSTMAKYDQLLFLNNDTIAVDDFLSKPIEYLQNSKVGAVGIKLLYADDLIQHAGIAFNHLKRPDHIFKFYKSDYPAVNKVYEMQAVTGACMFIKKNIYDKLGGFDESYLNGWEDIDLCFKIRNDGLKILYSGETSLYHLESQTEGRLRYAKQNEKIFFSKWFDKINVDENIFYNKVKNFNNSVSFNRKYDLPAKINFAIKIGVPTRQDKGWGDIYYAESLAKTIKGHGHNCVIHYLNEWNQSDEQVNVVIHIKGLSVYKLKKQNINVIWIINHPELHTIDELNQYDLVLCASQKYYDQIKYKLTVACHYLPQAADENIFDERHNSNKKEIDLLFVGNNYEFKNNRCRSIIDDIIKSNQDFNLHIIGNHWKGFVPDKFLRSEFVEWMQLPQLYGSAKIVLNDHQETMRENGFINNRTYDLAIMNAFQISNYVEGMDELGIETYKNPKELIDKINFYLQNEDERIKKANQAKEKCAEFTFNSHAEKIISYINQLANIQTIYTHCNICGHTGDDFLSMGARQKVRCPVCSSLERQRALWFLLKRDNMIKPGLKILEIAPLNNMIFRKYFEDAGCEYVCIDKWKHGNPLDKRDTAWIDYEMDICDLKFQDDTFDLVLMQHVIEEVPNDIKAFSEIARVTKAEGFALLEVPHNKNLRKTIEYAEPQKFGNLRQYGVDFYERLKNFFSYREELIVDGISFSKLGKQSREMNLNLPVLLDHPAMDKINFTNRFNDAINHLSKNGFTPITTAQVNNLIHQNVYYNHPYWLTLDDGSVEDINLAYPILKNNNLHATSFLIPNRIEKPVLDKWLSIAGNPFLDIQNHSLNHRQCFISSQIVAVYNGEYKYSNMMENISEMGYPIFEYSSCLAHKRFIPLNELIDEAVKFYNLNKEMKGEEYLRSLINHLESIFQSDFGVFETEGEYQDRINSEINLSNDKLCQLFNSDVYAFSFPWGLHSPQSLEKCSEQHSLSVVVNPKRINHSYSPFNIERIELTGSAYPLLLNTLYTTSPWEKYDYKDHPLAAVLMTTYNRQELLADAIQSVVDQTFRDWNLIIVNDGGDDVSEIINQFNDPRIKYFNCEHKGKSAALNFAIKNSLSKYIAYLDDDDRYYPNHLEVLISYLKSHPEYQFAYSISREVEMELTNTGWLVKQNIIRYAHQTSPQMLRFMNHIPNLCAVHLRNLFDKAGYYDESLDVLIDWDMFRRLSIYAPPAFINVITSEYSKRTYSTPQEKQITGLFVKDPVKYYQNRLKILYKKYPRSDNFISNKNCIILICNSKNYQSFKYSIYKIDKLQNDSPFDIVMICDIKLNKSIVELITVAENKHVMAMSCEDEVGTAQFIEDVISQNAWGKIALFDEVEKFNSQNLNAAFISQNRVTNFSGYLRKKYPLTKFKFPKKNEEAIVTIIIPTFNNWNYTDKCLKSIFNFSQNKSKFCVIIVDNNSSDETRVKLKSIAKKYSNLSVLLNDKNYCYAIANNIGAKNSTTQFLLFLNNDTEVRGDWLDKMIEAMQKYNAGIVGAKLLYPDRTIQHAGVAITEYENQLLAYHLFSKEKNDFVYANSYREFQAVTAACLLIKKELFFESGGFDENFVNGYEDVDLCFNVREKGKRIILCPETEIIHHESKSHGRFDFAVQNSKYLNQKWKDKIAADNLDKILFPLVSIVIPVHNQLDYTKKCLESIRRFTKLPIEIIIVNDGSTDETKKYLEEQKDLIILTNDSNSGYPISCNKGIQVSRGKYVVLLNNDTILTENWLSDLLEVFNENPSIGLVGPVSNSISGFQLDVEAKYSNISSMYQYAKLTAQKRKYSWMVVPRIAFVCAVISREVINRIGGLDERFSPGNYEDDDYCLRAQLAGFKTVVANDVFIHHYGSKSFKMQGEAEYSERLKTNREIFIHKWGADPDAIWINNIAFNQSKNLFVSIDNNKFVRSFERAKLNISEKEYELAFRELESAVKNYDSFEKSPHIISLEDLLILTANTGLVLNEFEKAKTYFENALAINPKSSEACFGLGKIFYQNGMLENAKTMLEWAVRNNPENKIASEALKNLEENLIEESQYQL